MVVAPVKVVHLGAYVNGLMILGGLCALTSCVPVWLGLQTLASGDHLGAALALALAWVLGRTGVELARLGQAGKEGRQRPGGGA